MHPFTIHLWLRLIFPPTLIFVLIIALIRSQPYDDSQVRELLLGSEDCPAPCFMGIRPGVTTAEEALDILNHHEWVDKVNDGQETIRWDWSGKQPDYINPQSEGYLTLPWDGRLVGSIGVSTNLRLASAHLLLGQPSLQDGFVRVDQLEVSTFYLQPPLSIWVSMSCPPTRTKFWQAPMLVNLSNRDAISYSIAHSDEITLTC